MVRALAAGCHPGPTVAVTLLAVLLGVGVGLDPATTVLLGAAVLAGQLSVGWSNDALDSARDARAGRRDKPAATGAVSPRSLGVAAVVAAVGTVVASLGLGLGAGLAHLLLPAAGWAYNLRLKSTWFSAAAYAVGFAGLPASVYLAGGGGVPWWAPTVGALLGVAAHVANVLPDLAEDAAAGVRGLPHRLGARWSTVLMGGVLAAAAVVSVLGPAPEPSPLVLLLGAAAVLGAAGSVAVAWRSPGRQGAFRGVVGVALLDVVLLVVVAAPG